MIISANKRYQLEINAALIDNTDVSVKCLQSHQNNVHVGSYIVIIDSF